MNSTTEKAHSLLQRLGVAQARYTEGTLVARSPVDGAVAGRVVETDAAGVQAAVARAHDAFFVWRSVPAPKRGELVGRND